MKFNYSKLIGFIYSNEKLKNKTGFASYLGVTVQGLDAKLRGKAPFKQEEIAKLKKDFNLTPEEIDAYFFTFEFPKVNEADLW